MIDSVLFKDVFSTAQMREIWDDYSIVQNWLDIEVALAESQAELGIIPKPIAEEIAKKAKVANLDLDVVRADVNRVGHSLVPVLRELQRKCEGKAGEYIHMGPTTQDIIDTGFMMAAKKAFAIIYDDLYAVEGYLLDLVEKHKDTIMAGRTHSVQALPITFGYKAAVWASEVHRHLERMKECMARDFAGQLSGAVGTLASFGQHAFEIQERVMRKLGLMVPDICWQASRDRVVSIVNVLALVAGTLGKIGNEVVTLQKTEFSELEEPWAQGNVGSSTMPHKRNPNAGEGMYSLSKIVKANLLMMHESMIQEHERDGAHWKIEWVALPEAFLLTGGILAKSKKVLKDLNVNSTKMLENLNVLKGLLLSEPVMFHLGEKIGKQTAHEVVYQISMKAFQEGGSFRDYLLNDDRVNKHMTAAEIDRLLDPYAYTGYSREIAERVLAKGRAARCRRSLDFGKR
jgi:adenylosuccinate lyase